MKKIAIDSDIHLICIKADRFPEGIPEAYNKLHSLNLSMNGRVFYGLSRPENGEITYYAAATENSRGEAESAGYESRTVFRGDYISTVITDYLSDLSIIGKTFEELLETEGLDPQGYCVEHYINDKDVVCMIRLAD